MKKLLVALVPVLMMLPLVAVIVMQHIVKSTHENPIPTLAVLPTETASLSPTPTTTMTDTPTFTITPTNIPTSTLTPSPTITLSTLMLRLTAINSDVTQDVLPTSITPTPTPLALPTADVPLPPTEIAAVPTGTLVPMVGWFNYDVDNPAINYAGKWDSYTRTYRSTHKRYVYSDDANAGMSFRFLGAGLRLHYVAYYTFGVFEVRLDGQVVATIDSYYPKTADNYGNFLSTEIFKLANGWHVLQVTRLDRKNPDSAGTVIALDGIDVYEAGPEPTITATVLPSETATLTPSPVPAKSIEVVFAPPTIQSTATPLAPGVVTVSLVVAYDANGNKIVDPAEGVQGISVRLVSIDTNEVLASGFTNPDGYVHLEITGSRQVRLVVPYLGKSWDIQPSINGDIQVILLVPPVNQPALIP